MGHLFTVLPNGIIWAYFEGTQCVKETKLHELLIANRLCFKGKTQRCQAMKD